jgi:hypothetical protein
LENKSNTELKWLSISAHVRYWEDATVSKENEYQDIEDDEGNLIPCKRNGNWEPIIDIQTGEIINWEKGKSANIHYKVCDAGEYFIFDDKLNLFSAEDSYVPNYLSIDGDGFGDYIILKVNSDGFISNWNPNKVYENSKSLPYLISHKWIFQPDYHSNRLKSILREKKLNYLLD